MTQVLNIARNFNFPTKTPVKGGATAEWCDLVSGSLHALVFANRMIWHLFWGEFKNCPKTSKC
jgi:hypothetical protein